MLKKKGLTLHDYLTQSFMLSLENKVVNGLWIGETLSPLELLTIRSFLYHGHEFRLWLYETVGNVPDDVLVCKAEEIIPRSNIFRYPENGRIDWGKGSYAGFSDIFRYKLLHERGGWWTDMDVTCLKPFEFESPWFFRDHWKYKVVGNVLKCPTGSLLMKSCYEESAREITAENASWHKPIEILNKYVKKFGLLDFRKSGLFNDDHSYKLRNYFEKEVKIPDSWYGIHWVNSAGKMAFRKESTFARLLKKFGVDPV